MVSKVVFIGLAALFVICEALPSYNDYSIRLAHDRSKAKVAKDKETAGTEEYNRGKAKTVNIGNKKTNDRSSKSEDINLKQPGGYSPYYNYPGYGGPVELSVKRKDDKQSYADESNYNAADTENESKIKKISGKEKVNSDTNIDRGTAAIDVNRPRYEPPPRYYQPRPYYAYPKYQAYYPY